MKSTASTTMIFILLAAPAATQSMPRATENKQLQPGGDYNSTFSSQQKVQWIPSNLSLDAAQSLLPESVARDLPHLASFDAGKVNGKVCYLVDIGHMRTFDGSRAEIQVEPEHPNAKSIVPFAGRSNAVYENTFWMVKSEEVKIQSHFIMVGSELNTRARGVAYSGKFLGDHRLVIKQDMTTFAHYVVEWDGTRMTQDFTKLNGAVDVKLSPFNVHLPMGVSSYIPMYGSGEASFSGFNMYVDMLAPVSQQSGLCGNFNGNSGDDPTGNGKGSSVDAYIRLNGGVVPDSENLFLMIGHPWQLVGSGMCSCDGSNIYNRDALSSGQNLESMKQQCVSTPDCVGLTAPTTFPGAFDMIKGPGGSFQHSGGCGAGPPTKVSSYPGYQCYAAPTVAPTTTTTTQAIVTWQLIGSGMCSCDGSNIYNRDALSSGQNLESMKQQCDSTPDCVGLTAPTTFPRVFDMIKGPGGSFQHSGGCGAGPPTNVRSYPGYQCYAKLPVAPAAA